MDDQTKLWVSRFLGVHIVTLLFIIFRKENSEQAFFRFAFVTLFTTVVFVVYDHFMGKL